jgi:predicted nucleotidyltransferase
MMKSSLDHLPEKKQRELECVVQILLEELEDALKGGSAEFKKMGRILKIILFGSYARGDWVDEPHTMKGYRSDYDLLIIVNNKKLTDFASYWYKAADRLLHDRGVSTQVGFIVHSRREVNTALRQGQYFFSDIRRQGIVLYELDDEPLAEPKPMSAGEEYKVAKMHFEKRFKYSLDFA